MRRPSMWAMGVAIFAFLIAAVAFQPPNTQAAQGGQTSIGQAIDDGVPPDIVASKQLEQFYIDVIDTSQGALGAGTTAAKTQICEAGGQTMKFSFYRDTGIGDSPPPTHEASFAKSVVFDHSPRSIPIRT